MEQQVIKLTAHQQEKFDEIRGYMSSNPKKPILLKGSAGVGKTVLVAVLGKALPGNVVYCAPTHQALAVLKTKMADHSSADFATTAKILQKKKIYQKDGTTDFVSMPNKKNPPLKDVRYLMLDESSMVDEIDLNSLLDYASIQGCTIVFIGDGKQLPPVGFDYSPVFDRDFFTVELTEIIRQGEGSPIITLSRDLDLLRYNRQKVINENKEGYMFTDDYDKIIRTLAKSNGSDALKYLAFTNVVVDKINKQVREYIYGDPAKIEPGEYIILTEPYGEKFVNNENIKIKSYDIIDKVFRFTTSTNISGDMTSYDTVQLKVYAVNPYADKEGNIYYDGYVLHESAERAYKSQTYFLSGLAKKGTIGWKDYAAFTENFMFFNYAHAITTHKSQGSTFKSVIIDYDNININQNNAIKLKMFYTAVTRASDMVVVKI